MSAICIKRTYPLFQSSRFARYNSSQSFGGIHEVA